jgi:hypothetical protein
LGGFAELVFAYFGARIANETDQTLFCKIPLPSAIDGSLVVPAGNQGRTRLLLLSVTVRFCPDATEGLVDSLSEIGDVHVLSEVTKARSAALELHCHIVVACPGREGARV